MNLEELKKEFKQIRSGYNETDEKIWQWIDQNFVPKSEYEVLKAENEKLGKVVSESAKLLTDNIIDVEEARQEERVRIVEQINETAKKFYAINPLVLADEFVEAITAVQLTQSDENIPTNLEPQPSEEKI